MRPATSSPCAPGRACSARHRVTPPRWRRDLGRSTTFPAHQYDRGENGACPSGRRAPARGHPDSPRLPRREPYPEPALDGRRVPVVVEMRYGEPADPDPFEKERAMILLNPRHLERAYADARSAEVMRKTVEFFETKGKIRLKEDYHAQAWYADFLDFVRREHIFATMCTPAGYGAADSRWDTWRICEFAEILGFYGLQYWYTWQVSVLGLGPIWMSRNEDVKQRTARLLDGGAIFGFGLSEKAHGADIYSTDMVLTPDGDGFRATGGKYYIGNGNLAGMVSVFGRRADIEGEDGYVFFAADSQHANYQLVK